MSKVWGIIIVSLCLLASQLTSAQSLSTKLEKENKRLSVVASFSVDSNTQALGNVDNSAGYEISVSPSYKTSKNYSLSTGLRLTKRYEGERRFDMANLPINFSRTAYKLSGAISLKPKLSLILPTNELDRSINNFKLAQKVSLSSVIELHPKVISTLSASGRLNQHKYTVSERAGANIETLASVAATVGYRLFGNLEISNTSSYSVARTYRNFARNKFSFSQSIDYSLGKWSISLGHSNGGSILEQDGRSSNIALFDNRSSSFSAGASYTY